MATFNDLTGKVFGDLTVINRTYNKGSKVCWHCVCKCGNTRDVIASDLTLGIIISCKECGLLRRSKARMKIPPKVGVFTPIRPVVEPNRKGNVKWVFRCECGNEITSTYWNLSKRHDVDKCTCNILKSSDDLLGKTFGRLRVVEYNGKRNGRHNWKCLCSCGNPEFVFVDANNLISGHTQSCGCYRSQRISETKFNDLTGKRFGRWLVLGRDVSRKGHVYYKCQCSCDKKTIKSVCGTNLLSGKSTSCGCYNSELARDRQLIDLSGRRFGRWTVNYRSSERPMYYVCTCDCGNIKEVFEGNLTNESSQSCGECGYVCFNGSKEENAIKRFVNEIGVFEFNKVKRFLDGKEIDLYNDELKLGIEYNGSLFHATVGGLYRDKPKDYHQQKFLLAKEKGIHLINIFDVDWKNNKEKIKMYLSSLFIPQKKLMARKCEVKKIDNISACEFVDKYHIQGSNKAMMKINYGLYYNDELMATMSFGKLRMNKTEEGQYELHRYCVKDGYTIVGGANRLLKMFEKEYAPKYIKSYSDNDYFLGGIYERLGFENKGQCTPRYYWYLNGEEIKRERCKLDRLEKEYPELLEEAYRINASNKEDYVMSQLKACKVYRSGNTKWVKIYD